MSLSDLASLGSFISAVAVLVSLIFLYFQLRQIGAQIRQAEKNQKAVIGQGRTNRMVELALRTAEPGLGEAMANVFTNSDALKPHQLFQFVHFSRALLLNAEDTFYQHENGLLEDEPYAGFVNAMRTTVANPAMRLMWEFHRRSYGAAFGAFVDKLAGETALEPLIVPDEQLTIWRTGIAAMTTAATPP
jgi:hypothetical protein